MRQDIVVPKVYGVFIVMKKLFEYTFASRNLHWLFVFPVLILTGCECYQSTAPWWPKRANINVPGLEGRWVSANDPKKSYRVKWVPEARSYLVDISMPHEKTYRAIVSITRINRQLVADAASSTGSDDLLTLPVHKPFPIIMQGDELNIFFVTNKAMKTAARRDHAEVYKIKYSEEDVRNLICTNSSEELYRILRHALAVEDASKRLAFDKLKKRP